MRIAWSWEIFDMKEQQLQQLCHDISTEFDVSVIPTHIINGRRWEFIGNKRQTEIPVSPPYRIKVSEEWGMIIYNWHSLLPQQQQNIVSLIQSVRPD
jgi:hypothetical protein